MQEIKFQIIYKGKVWCDHFDSHEDVMESFNEYQDDVKYDNRFLSIEVMIDRDYKRMDGRNDTRGTQKEIAEEFMDKTYKNAMRKIEAMKNAMRS